MAEDCGGRGGREGRSSRLCHTALLGLQGLLSSVPVLPYLRGLFGLWSFFGVVITTAYVARMHSHASADAFESPITNLRELAESNIPVHLSDVKRSSYEEATRSERMSSSREREE